MHADDQSLIEKLGYQKSEAVDTVDAPEWFLEYLRGNDVHTHAKLPTEWLHMFMTRRERTEHFLLHLKFNEIQKGLWISWPKAGSGIHTDIDEEDVRHMFKRYDWIEDGFCKIDDTWNALKFIRQE